jgi:hypothetical protein
LTRNATIFRSIKEIITKELIMAESLQQFASSESRLFDRAPVFGKRNPIPADPKRYQTPEKIRQTGRDLHTLDLAYKIGQFFKSLPFETLFEEEISCSIDFDTLGLFYAPKCEDILVSSGLVVYFYRSLPFALGTPLGKWSFLNPSRCVNTKQFKKIIKKTLSLELIPEGELRQQGHKQSPHISVYEITRWREEKIEYAEVKKFDGSNKAEVLSSHRLHKVWKKFSQYNAKVIKWN